MPASDTTVTLDDIIITPALSHRLSSRLDPSVELAALKDLVHHFTIEPAGLLQRLVEIAVDRCEAGSAGVSLLESGPREGEGIFRWVAMAGAYRPYVGGTTPESFSPCGTCLARGAAQLYDRPARLFTYLAETTPEIIEGLVVPLRSAFKPAVIGTIWIVSHDVKQITNRELSIMSDLANFAAAAVALQQARDQAQAADRAKDEFMAVVSHELRRPLTAIVGWSELLLSGRSTPAIAARAIAGLGEAARRQQAMVEDLLDAARTVTATLKLTEVDMDLAAVVRSAVDTIADVAQERGVELSAAIDGTLPFHGDPDRLHQVVGNLLDNAVKFTPPGGRVWLSLRQLPNAVEIVVRDDGRGIPAQAVPMIFEAFRGAHASSTRRENGLGLGLTIARHLTTLHGGTIEAQSAGEGRGAQFTVRLPANGVLAVGLMEPARDSSLEQRQRLDGVTVLVVDDEQDVLDILGVTLTQAGAAVNTASSVSGALDAVARQPIDVLISDISMPGQDGFDLLARLDRTQPGRRPRLAIAVTALAGGRERERILAAGFDHHISKPVDLGLLLQLVATSASPQEAR